MHSPLEGISILDFTHAAAGPLATMVLGRMGAEIIKIEKPGRGDGARHMGSPMFGAGLSDYFVSLNRSKKSVAIDLSKPEGRDLARQLSTRCDVIIENFRPGVMDRLGLGFDDLAPSHPGLVYCSISGFGASGPWSGKPANDIIIQSVSGLMAITGEESGDPVRVGAPVCDYTAGLYAAVGILGALQQPSQVRESQHVEISMLGSALSLLSNFIPSIVDGGAIVARMGSAHPQLVPYQAFRCRDGEYILVGAFTDSFWRRLARALGREDWVTDEGFASNAGRLAHRSVLIPALEDIFAGEDRDHWVELLDQADVPNGPVLTPNDAVRSEQAECTGLIEEISQGATSAHVADGAMVCDAWPETEGTFPPRLGEQTDDVLAQHLGLSAGQLDDLRTSGVIATATPG
jgi:crotonobetainyl-CoA:carnitine CoA-transferase CaiB-like acyl-CoA transferase